MRRDFFHDMYFITVGPPFHRVQHGVVWQRTVTGTGQQTIEPILPSVVPSIVLIRVSISVSLAIHVRSRGGLLRKPVADRSLPETVVGTRCCLPKANRACLDCSRQATMYAMSMSSKIASRRLTIFASAGVHLSVRTVADGMDRAMVTFVYLPLLACVEIVHAHPRITR
jgi:hypothetical protein